MFLFTDVLIVAKCIVSNRRYISEMAIPLPEIEIVKNGKFMTIGDSGPKTLEIEFEDESISNIWEKYIEFWSKYNEDSPRFSLDSQTSKEDEISTTKFLLKSKRVVSIKISDSVPEHFV